jgi:predicted RNA binding protein YcfA (HicA-like mRNA interferase family)
LKKHKAKRIWSWREVVKVLIKICYRLANQKGSHVTLVPKCASEPGRTLPVIVPRHNELKLGTFNSILARVNLSKEEFVDLAN